MSTELAESGFEPPAVSPTPAELVQQLQWIDDKIPRDVIYQIRARKDECIPALLDAIRTDLARFRNDEEPQDPSFFAFHLLAEFRIKELAPLLIEILSQPDNDVYDFLGDYSTEELPAVLAELLDSSEALDQVIRNPEIPALERWNCANAYLGFVQRGRLTRDEAVRALHSQFLWALEQSDEVHNELAGYLILSLLDYCPLEAQADIERAFAEDRIDPTLTDWESAQIELAKGVEACLAEQRILVCLNDTIAALEKYETSRSSSDFWGDDHLESTDRLDDDFDEELLGDDPEDDLSQVELAESAMHPDTFVRETTRVGRNDPCPCGSGRKYKKCCGNQ